jgi:hypothetical protein
MDAAFAAGAAQGDQRFGKLVPYWVYDGPARIVRHVFVSPLSQDHDATNG